MADEAGAKVVREARKAGGIDPAERLERLRRRSIKRFREAVYSGLPRSCNLCGYQGAFGPIGMPPRLDAQCPACLSKERHRLMRLWIERASPIRASDRVLHFSPDEPERTIAQLIRKTAGHYRTADLMMGRVDLKLDIEAMDQPDADWDVIIANQILEHVDHRKALAECHRILRPGGWMLATTPIVEAWPETYVNDAITDERGRFFHFGQSDHIRYFGRDLKDDMRAAGFDLEEVVAVEPDVLRYGLIRGETLFILRKPGGAPDGGLA